MNNHRLKSQNVKGWIIIKLPSKKFFHKNVLHNYYEITLLYVFLKADLEVLFTRNSIIGIF